MIHLKTEIISSIATKSNSNGTIEIQYNELIGPGLEHWFLDESFRKCSPTPHCVVLPLKIVNLVAEIRSVSVSVSISISGVLDNIFEKIQRID